MKPPTLANMTLQETGTNPCGAEIKVVTRRDNISTLGDPIPPHLYNDFMADDPTRSTVGRLTGGYDFQKAYRSGQL